MFLSYGSNMVHLICITDIKKYIVIVIDLI